jgi:hypothetical protein
MYILSYIKNYKQIDQNFKTFLSAKIEKIYLEEVQNIYNSQIIKIK